MNMTFFLCFFIIYFQATFSQSDFQKGPELNKQNLQGRHIYTMTIFKNYTRESYVSIISYVFYIYQIFL
jgi:hypothetical protein